MALLEVQKAAEAQVVTGNRYTVAHDVATAVSSRLRRKPFTVIFICLLYHVPVQQVVLEQLAARLYIFLRNLCKLLVETILDHRHVELDAFSLSLAITLVSRYGVRYKVIAIQEEMRLLEQLEVCVLP